MNAQKHALIQLIHCHKHHLKGFNLELPKEQIIAITGVSGSGKSTLAYDTIYAEGQRRYLESLSLKTRAWFNQRPNPEVDHIIGISPTLCLKQQQVAPRKNWTVAAHLEVLDLLALLYAKVGVQYSPSSKKPLERYAKEEIADRLSKEMGKRLLVSAFVPSVNKEEDIPALLQSGYTRLKIDGRDIDPEAITSTDAKSQSPIEVVVDRLAIREGLFDRILASVEHALSIGQGILKVEDADSKEIAFFSEVYYCPESKLKFPPLQAADFLLRQRGACPSCQGSGLGNGAQQAVCPDCQGQRLKATALHVRLGAWSLPAFLEQSAEQALYTLQGLQLELAPTKERYWKELTPFIEKELLNLKRFGLGALSLSQEMHTLSTGECQRVHIIKNLSQELSGLIYILDEPSQGLHPKDMAYIEELILRLKELKNTVILVEHAKEIISLADHVIEMGPGAGHLGGEVIFQGSFQELKEADTITGRWLKGLEKMPSPLNKKGRHFLTIPPLQERHLRLEKLKIPLHCIAAITGVSGSGKTQLAFDIIESNLTKMLRQEEPKIPLSFDAKALSRVIAIDQRSLRLNDRAIPASYLGILTPIRELYASTRLAKLRGYGSERFSLNKKGGRCDHCSGLGEVKLQLELLPDVSVPCEACRGLRFHAETLQVTFKGLSIGETLALTFSKAKDIFSAIPPLKQTMELMEEVGLGYLALGQKGSSLSGGEAQRLKLVADLSNASLQSTLYLLDEPTRGLHLDDQRKLAIALQKLVQKGHSVLMIEQREEMLSISDWILELYPNRPFFEGRVL
ncbi:MAG: Excinuclease subunit [Chlamydiales bacterium]|jgi:excinuclease ABC subunit A|nr:Excinuclease subunit [Chlamydiales bacterium]